MLATVQMVMRVTALRGSVPQQWLTDFQAAMEGYGVVALTQRAQLADVYAELEGSSRCAGQAQQAGSLSGAGGRRGWQSVWSRQVQQAGSLSGAGASLGASACACDEK